eukprot:351624-Chlamydomonas_euryale.AAC.1
MLLPPSVARTHAKRAYTRAAPAAPCRSCRALPFGSRTPVHSEVRARPTAYATRGMGARKLPRRRLPPRPSRPLLPILCRC